MAEWRKCLFIGGCADGEFRDVDLADRMIPVYEMPKTPSIWGGCPDSVARNMTVNSPTRHLYEQQKFWFDDKGQHEVFYVIRDMTPREAFQAMIQGYKRVDKGRGPLRYIGDDR